MEIDLAYLNEVEQCKESYQTIYEKIVATACQLENIEEDIELSCIVVDEMKIHEMNRTYRSIDRPTDVISFALEDSEQYYCEGQPRNIGDIFISYPHAIKQAEEYGHSLYREMCFLFTHGVLHLLGYDHMNEEDEAKMIEKQQFILSKLEIGRE